MIATAAPQISSDAFAFLSAYIYRHSRIRLSADKQALLASRVSKRLRQLGLASFEDYCSLLKSPAGAAETRSLVDVVSTNHTHFFREKAHFDFLTSVLLPEWVARHGTTTAQFRAWSAACSSGEEPYTLAVVLAEFCRTRSALAWHIDGSDICTRILERAAAAIFAQDRMELPDPALLHRYFQKGTERFAGYCRVKAQLQQQVTLHHVNLFQESYPIAAGLDVIFCRNVMIYFDQESIQTLVNRLAGQLRPGGYLIVGLSESLLGIKHPLTQVRPGIYRRDLLPHAIGAIPAS